MTIDVKHLKMYYVVTELKTRSFKLKLLMSSIIFLVKEYLLKINCDL